MFKFFFKILRGFVEGFLDNSKQFMVEKAGTVGSSVKNGVDEVAVIVKDRAQSAGKLITTKAGDIRTGVVTTMDKPFITSRKMVILGLAVAVLSGVVLGMLISPRKNIALGSYNKLKPTDKDIEEAEDDAEAKCDKKKKCCLKKCK